jgi:hypothetical protein
MRCIILETPYAGDVARNTIFARVCMLDCLRRGESVFASHLLYTQVLDDTIPEERMCGINAGLEWGMKADATVVYTDFGISRGMDLGIRAAVKANRIVIERTWVTQHRLTIADLEKSYVNAMLAYIIAGQVNGEWPPWDGCTCEQIKAADPGRHFRGCPLR